MVYFSIQVFGGSQIRFPNRGTAGFFYPAQVPAAWFKIQEFRTKSKALIGLNFTVA
jgi:hypothetical protein